MANFCKADNCILEEFRPGAEFCIFHFDIPEEWYRTAEEKQHALIDYLATASNNGSCDSEWEEVGLEGGLEIANITVDSMFSECLLRSNRRLWFTRCKFEHDLLMVNCSHQGARLFNNCEFGDGSNGCLQFVNAEFKGELFIRGPYAKIIFDNCTLWASLGILSPGGHEGEHTLPKAQLNNCRFDTVSPETWRTLESDGQLWLQDCGLYAPMTASADPLQLHRCGIHNDLRVEVWEGGSSLDLFLVKLYHSITIANPNVMSPGQIKILGLQQYGDTKVIFEDIDLGDLYSQTLDFTFKDVQLTNVTYARLKNRVGFSLERACTQGGQANSLDQTRENLLLLKESYRNLKIYYDREADYQMANNFHAGELWAQWQLNISGVEGWRSMLSKWASWHALYHWISDFGQSWLRPLGWIAGSFLLAWIAFIAIGVYPEGPHSQFFASMKERLWYGLGFAANNLAMWLKFTGPRSLTPFHWMGWMVAGGQISVTIVAGTFFLLALRRRFKR